MSDFDSLVCVHQMDQPNRWVPSQDLANKTVKQIQNILQLQGQILIQTPLYRKILDPESVPLKEYSQLIIQWPKSKPQDKYPPANFHIHILPNSNKCVNSLTTAIRTQLTEIVFPNIHIDYDPDTCKTVKDWITLASKTFNMGCSDEKLIKLSDDSEVSPSDSISSVLEQSIAEVKNNGTEPIFAFSCKMPDDSLKNITRRCQTASEIITSEGSFVNDLNNLIGYYQPEIEQSSIFDQANTKYIFNDIPKIRDTHTQLYEELQKIKVNYAAQFGAIFLNFLDLFKKSLPFISGFKNVDDTIKKKLEDNSYKRAKFEEIEANCPTLKSFMTYYITPVQRYPRYPLLIRDLLKVTPDFHPDKPYLQKALTDIDNMNKSLDQTSAKVKQLLQIQDIERRTNSCIADDGREFVLQMNVRIAKPKSMTGIIYLFNNLVMITQVKKNNETIIMTTGLLNFRFYNGRPSAESIVFLLDPKDKDRDRDKTVFYTLYFEEYADKKNWIEAFNKCRIKELSNINSKSNFIKWVDLEMGETLYPLLGHSGAKLNNEIIFVGGLNQSNSPTSNMVIYNIDDSKWSSKPTNLSPVAFHTITNYNNKLYLAFGQTAKSASNEIWKYDGTEWTKVCSSKHDRFGHTTVVYNDLLYIFGGKSRDKFSTDMLIFDPSNNTIESVPVPSSGPSPRFFHSACVVDDSMFIIGGKTERQISADVYKYNFNTKEWTHLPSQLPMIYGHKSIILAQKYLFVIGGCETGGKPSKTKCINTETMETVRIEHFGNKPCGLFRFAIAKLSEYRAIVYGGNDQFSGSKVALSCSYIMDVEEGFQENRQYNPSAQKESRREISLFENSSSEKLLPTSPVEKQTLSPKPTFPKPQSPPVKHIPTLPVSTTITDSDSSSIDSLPVKKMPECTRSSTIDISLASNPLFNKRRQVTGESAQAPSLLQPPKDIEEKAPQVMQEQRKRSQTMELSQPNNPLHEICGAKSPKEQLEENQSADEQKHNKRRKHRKKPYTRHNPSLEPRSGAKITDDSDKDETTDYDNQSEEDDKLKGSNPVVTPESPETNNQLPLTETKTEPSMPVKEEQQNESIERIQSIPVRVVPPIMPTQTRQPAKPSRVYSQSTILHAPFNIQKKEFVPNPDLKLSSTFKADEIFIKFGIDTSELNVIELGKIQMKAKRLFALLKNNDDLESQINASQNSQTSKDSFMLKVSDEFNKTRVAKITKDDSYQNVLEKIGHLINKDCSNCEFSLQLPGDDAVGLSEETFQEMKEKISQEGLPFMKVSEL